MPHAMNYAANTYLAVTVSPSSPYMSDPSSLAEVHSQLRYVGKVGELADVQLLRVPKSEWETVPKSEWETVPKSEWETVQDAVQQALRGAAGVQSVDVQVPRQRKQRDEF